MCLNGKCTALALLSRFHHDNNAKIDEGKIHLNKTQKPGMKVRDTTERGSKLTVPLRKIHKYYVNLKHYKKYKNPICKNDKNESLLQLIKSLSRRNYQLIEDYVTYCISGDRLPGVKVSLRKAAE